MVFRNQRKGPDTAGAIAEHLRFLERVREPHKASGLTLNRHERRTLAAAERCVERYVSRIAKMAERRGR